MRASIHFHLTGCGKLMPQGISEATVNQSAARVPCPTALQCLGISGAADQACTVKLDGCKLCLEGQAPLG